MENSIKPKPQAMLDGLTTEAQRPVVPTVFVCMSHQLTEEQEQDLHDKFGASTYVGEQSDGNDSFDQWERRVSIVTVSPELKRRTSQLPANYSLAEVQKVAKAIVAEAVLAGAKYFVCMGEPTLAMWANIYAYNFVGRIYAYKHNVEQPLGMTCLASTTVRTSVDEVQADGSVKTTAVFKHVQWRPMF